MKLINQTWSFEILPDDILNKIEKIGRVCYKSEDRITKDSSEKFVRSLIKSGHESVLEHISVSVRFITNRSVTHELVRHRLCSFSQESTRYVKYDGKMEFINPVWFRGDTLKKDEEVLSEITFIKACYSSEIAYHKLLDNGWKPEQAREILPNALKTEIVVTANLREWRHIFKLRTSKKAHPQIRELFKSCLDGFKREIPIIFDNI